MPAPFQLLASHPALDFVNTLDDRFAPAGPRELLQSYPDLLAFAGESKLLRPSEIAGLADRSQSSHAAKVLRGARELREALAQTLYELVEGRSEPPGSLVTLERVFQDSRQHQELGWEGSGSFDQSAGHWQWQWGRFSTRLELPVWAVASSAMRLLTSPELGYVRACGSETCRWLFLDTSKNHSRRWCDMKICGNRMKARRFQARQ